MQKEKKTTPQMAIAAFEKSCDELARQVNHRLFDDSRSWYWVGDEKGGICDFDDADFLTPEEMVIILQTPHFTYDQYAEWRDANIEYGETKGFINLRSWIKGCRHSMLADKVKKETKNKNMKFAEVIEGLQQGHIYSRSSWDGKKFISLQIPADIPSDIIPNMTSLCMEAKQILLRHGDRMIHYRNQVLLVTLSPVTSQNIATYYVPSWTDIFADDWLLINGEL